MLISGCHLCDWMQVRSKKQQKKIPKQIIPFMKEGMFPSCSYQGICFSKEGREGGLLYQDISGVSQARSTPALCQAP